jgi:hypothetical protein
MVVLIDKVDRELRTDSSVIRQDPPIPCGRDPPIPCCPDPDAVRLFELWMISSIQNVIDFAMNTTKHLVSLDDNSQQLSETNLTLRG